MATRQRRRIGRHIDPEDTAATQATFLEAFAKGGTVLHAAKAAGVHRATVYRWRDSDPAFAAEYAHAESDANDLIRGEIWRRGVTGWIETQTTVEIDADGVETRKTVKTRKYSDAMLRLAAMARMPEYKEKLDVTSQDKTIAAYAAIAAIAEDPHASGLASDLLDAITGPSVNASRPLVDSQP